MKTFCLTFALLLQACTYQHTSLIAGSAMQTFGLKSSHDFQREAEWRLSRKTHITVLPTNDSELGVPRLVSRINTTLYQSFNAHFETSYFEQSERYADSDIRLSSAMTSGVLVRAEVMEFNRRRNSWSEIHDGPDLHDQAHIGRDEIKLRLIFVDAESSKIIDHVVMTSKAGFGRENAVYDGTLLNEGFTRLLSQIM